MPFSIPLIPVSKSLFLNDKFIILVVLVSVLVTVILTHQVASLGGYDGGGGNNDVILIDIFDDDDDALAVGAGGKGVPEGRRTRTRTDRPVARPETDPSAASTVASNRVDRGLPRNPGGHNDSDDGGDGDSDGNGDGDGSISSDLTMAAPRRTRKTREPPIHPV